MIELRRSQPSSKRLTKLQKLLEGAQMTVVVLNSADKFVQVGFLRHMSRACFAITNAPLGENLFKILPVKASMADEAWVDAHLLGIVARNIEESEILAKRATLRRSRYDLPISEKPRFKAAVLNDHVQLRS